MKFKILLLLAVSLFVTSCTVDYAYCIKVEVKNRVSTLPMTIELVDDQGKVVSTISDDHGATLYYEMQPEVIPFQAFVANHIKYIRFNNEVQIDIIKTSLTNLDNYELLDSSKTYREYSCTLTNKDYQYALENGEKLNQ